MAVMVSKRFMNILPGVSFGDHLGVEASFSIDGEIGGAFGCRGGDAVVPVLNRYAERFAAAGATVFASRDWHPAKTSHFKAYGGVWPPHRVQGTPGRGFHPQRSV